MSRLDPLIQKLQRAKLPYSQTWGRPAAARVEAPLAALERAAAEFFEALAPPKPGPYMGEADIPRPSAQGGWLDGPERTASLIASLEAAAKGRGANIYRFGSLHSAVVDYAPAADKAWWHGQAAGLVAGLLRAEPDVIKRLKELGVLVWEGAPDELNAGDELWRLVHIDWLQSHEDIFRFVIDSTPMGRRCRFCLITEPPESRELKPVELERRHGTTVVNGVVSIVPGGGLTHAGCRRHWLRWLELASRYQSEEQAQAADAAAGRQPRAKKHTIPQVKLDRPIT